MATAQPRFLWNYFKIITFNIFTPTVKITEGKQIEISKDIKENL